MEEATKKGQEALAQLLRLMLAGLNHLPILQLVRVLPQLISLLPPAKMMLSAVFNLLNFNSPPPGQNINGLMETLNIN